MSQHTVYSVSIVCWYSSAHIASLCLCSTIIQCTHTERRVPYGCEQPRSATEEAPRRGRSLPTSSWAPLPMGRSPSVRHTELHGYALYSVVRQLRVVLIYKERRHRPWSRWMGHTCTFHRRCWYRCWFFTKDRMQLEEASFCSGHRRVVCVCRHARQRPCAAAAAAAAIVVADSRLACAVSWWR